MLKSSSIELTYRLRSQHKASATQGFPKAPVTTYVNCTKVCLHATSPPLLPCQLTYDRLGGMCRSRWK